MADPWVSGYHWLENGLTGKAWRDWAGKDQKAWQRFSLENQIDRETPPVFLWHTAADSTVPVENSLVFAQKLSEYKVPFELHIYPFGVHGLSLAVKEVEEPERAACGCHVAGG